MGRTPWSSLRTSAAGVVILRAVHRVRSLAAILAIAAVMGLTGCGDIVTATPAPEAENQLDSPPTATATKPKTALAGNSSSNSPPRIWSVNFEPAQPSGDDRVRIQVEAEDADGDPLFFEYQWELDGEVIDEDSRSLALSDAARGSVLAVTVTASDGVATSAATRSEVVLVNRPARIERLSIRPAKNIIAGMNVTATPEAIDPEGDAVEFLYQWRFNDELSEERSAVFSTQGLKRGDTFTVTVVANDGRTPSEPFTSPDLQIANAPPRITSKPGAPSNDGVFRYLVAAEDPDGDAGLQFNLLDAPHGMEIDTLSGSITWQPQPDQLGSRLVSVVVDDLQGGRSKQSFEVSVDDYRAN